MMRYIYAAIVALFAALLVHLTTLVLLPPVTLGTAWDRIFDAANSGDGAVVELEKLSDTDRAALQLDPQFRHFVCRYDLNNGIFHITADPTETLWSVGVMTSSVTPVFSANDRNAPGGQLDLIAVNDEQMRELRQSLPDMFVNSMIAPTSDDDGFVVVRIFSPDESWLPVSDAFQDSISCGYR